ncbi:MAG: response regulator [Acidobacteria bacterium]|nr:response regulator [Acidobacteriota bacterium]
MDRILVADSEPETGDAVSGWLSAAGYAPVRAVSAENALEEIEATPPALILLDMQIPGRGALDFCQSIQSNEAMARIPIVVMGSNGTTHDRIRCLDAGAEDFLSKPIHREELLARVRALLRAKHLSDRLLMSYFEMDKLGTFAESFAGRIVADLRAKDVASTMARQVLGPEAGLPNHPALIWGGIEVRGIVWGVLCYYEQEHWQQQFVEIPPGALAQVLKPFERGEGQYLSKAAPADEIRNLLHLPHSLRLGNFVAIISGSHSVFAAGYPWEVGLFELPLLRAMMRHWTVFERIRLETRQVEKAFSYTMEALALAAEIYDGETANHIRRIGSYAARIAAQLGTDERFARWLSKCSQMHDVGKITIPVDIIRKPGPLSEQEIAIMQTHTTNGAHILGGSPQLAVARNIALSHHENHDGTGYPSGLRGEEIPFEARVVRVIDVYDALRTTRAYKRPFTHDEALDVMRRGDDRLSPAHFDARILEAFLDDRDRMLAIFEGFGSPGRRERS